MICIAAFELLLFDRLEKIKQVNESVDLENNAYLSFSGGKDSTVLHYLLDMALPGNKIPRVYINTGIEYKDIRLFVEKLAKTDDRIIIINPKVNIKKMLEEEGYPFKSKEHSLKVFEYKKGSHATTIMKYKNGGPFGCPKKLMYQYESSFTLKISNRCCYKLKKDIAENWSKENHKSITITGMRKAEGGERKNLNCFTNKGKKFHPLVPIPNEWIEQFIKVCKIELCRLYYPPFNFERTGCKGCPYNLHLQKDLDIMLELLPEERIQCELIWGKVYKEYRRIGYRLRKELNMTELDLLQNILIK